MFQSTHSLRSATVRDANSRQHVTVSIHALLAECDRICPDQPPPHQGFQSTHSLRSATERRLLTACLYIQFQSTHSLRSATDDVKLVSVFPLVSIHALLAECDTMVSHAVRVVRGFNPRTPCGVRPFPAALHQWFLQFQSTHSLRSATYHFLMEDGNEKVSIHALLAECDATHPATRRRSWSFNPRTPCGVRHDGGKPPLRLFGVSIHALLAECDF